MGQGGDMSEATFRSMRTDSFEGDDDSLIFSLSSFYGAAMRPGASTVLFDAGCVPGISHFLDVVVGKYDVSRYVRLAEFMNQTQPIPETDDEELADTPNQMTTLTFPMKGHFLPNELFLEILLFCSPVTLISLLEVCHEIHTFIERSFFWRQYYCSYFRVSTENTHNFKEHCHPILTACRDGNWKQQFVEDYVLRLCSDDISHVNYDAMSHSQHSFCPFYGLYGLGTIISREGLSMENLEGSSLASARTRVFRNLLQVASDGTLFSSLKKFMLYGMSVLEQCAAVRLFGYFAQSCFYLCLRENSDDDPTRFSLIDKTRVRQIRDRLIAPLLDENIFQGMYYFGIRGLVLSSRLLAQYLYDDRGALGNVHMHDVICEKIGHIILQNPYLAELLPMMPSSMHNSMAYQGRRFEFYGIARSCSRTQACTGLGALCLEQAWIFFSSMAALAPAETFAFLREKTDFFSLEGLERFKSLTLSNLILQNSVHLSRRRVIERLAANSLEVRNTLYAEFEEYLVLDACCPPNESLMHFGYLPGNPLLAQLASSNILIREAYRSSSFRPLVSHGSESESEAKAKKFVSLAVRAFRQKDLNTATRHFERALNTFSYAKRNRIRRGKILSNLCATHIKAGRPLEALRAGRASLMFCPKFAPTHARIIEALELYGANSGSSVVMNVLYNQFVYHSEIQKVLVPSEKPETAPLAYTVMSLLTMAGFKSAYGRESYAGRSLEYEEEGDLEFVEREEKQYGEPFPFVGKTDDQFLYQRPFDWEAAALSGD